MIRAVLAGIGCAVLYASSPAVAADFPMRPMKAQPPIHVEPYVAWTGFYAGINGGYGFGTSRWSAGAATTGDFDLNGGMVGGTLGFNLQTGSIVWGVETDLDWTDVKGSPAAAVCVPGVCQTSNNWLGTTRARIGYAMDRMMLYGTAGAAYGDVKATTAGGSASATAIGWAAGGGVEWGFLPQWSVKVEYLFVDLEDRACNAACGGPPKVDVKFTTNIVRAGVNFRF